MACGAAGWVAAPSTVALTPEIRSAKGSGGRVSSVRDRKRRKSKYSLVPPLETQAQEAPRSLCRWWSSRESWVSSGVFRPLGTISAEVSEGCGVTEKGGAALPRLLDDIPADDIPAPNVGATKAGRNQDKSYSE